MVILDFMMRIVGVGVGDFGCAWARICLFGDWLWIKAVGLIDWGGFSMGGGG
jgi:hypothetical protein